jgi:hypothetical protein
MDRYEEKSDGRQMRQREYSEASITLNGKFSGEASVEIYRNSLYSCNNIRYHKIELKLVY